MLAHIVTEGTELVAEHHSSACTSEDESADTIGPKDSTTENCETEQNGFNCSSRKGEITAKEEKDKGKRVQMLKRNGRPRNIKTKMQCTEESMEHEAKDIEDKDEITKGQKIMEQEDSKISGRPVQINGSDIEGQKIELTRIKELEKIGQMPGRDGSPSTAKNRKQYDEIVENKINKGLRKQKGQEEEKKRMVKDKRGGRTNGLGLDRTKRCNNDRTLRRRTQDKIQT